ncbi:hypothetical protein H9L13_07965 [Sphingomonas lutea]|uniref:Uncharacterized protein n=1 Tax=Sphingomonas lutea TaxID=1045317 RepID=A0A7G9SLF6_9SPHN|nr:hypothetical protein [Sphingomonas lutea]QNN68681.1 hypothetical protein H9L13_07965 [Sphingomonas lutea]
MTAVIGAKITGASIRTGPIFMGFNAVMGRRQIVEQPLADKAPAIQVPMSAGSKPPYDAADNPPNDSAEETTSEQAANRTSNDGSQDPAQGGDDYELDDKVACIAL